MLIQKHAHRLNEISNRLAVIEAESKALFDENMRLSKEVCELYEPDAEDSDESYDWFTDTLEGKGPVFETQEEADENGRLEALGEAMVEQYVERQRAEEPIRFV